MKHDTLQLRMRTLTYLILTYLDKYYATYGYHPRFDLVAERGCHIGNHRLRLGANVHQRYRVVTIRNATICPLTNDPAPDFYLAGYLPWPYLWPYSALSFA